jgi:hypothetical protein
MFVELSIAAGINDGMFGILVGGLYVSKAARHSASKSFVG